MTAFGDAAQAWNRRYEGAEFHFGTAPNDWLREHVGALPPHGRVLCVADGEGRNSVWLARQGFDVVAFDVADKAVDKARAFAKAQGVEVRFDVADVDGFAWSRDGFDAVVAIFVQFADPALRARLAERMVDALRPGGVLLLLGYTPRQLAYGTGGQPFVSHLYTEELLRELFDGRLVVDELRSFDAVLAEGAGHAGMSALVGLVAHRPRPDGG